MVESMLSVPHIQGEKGLGPKDLQVSGTRSKGTPARHLVMTQSFWGENRGLVKTGLGL